MVLTRIHKACKPIHRSDENLFRFGTGNPIIKYQFHRFAKKNENVWNHSFIFPIRAFKKSQPKPSDSNNNFLEEKSLFRYGYYFQTFTASPKIIEEINKNKIRFSVIHRFGLCEYAISSQILLSSASMPKMSRIIRTVIIAADFIARR